MKLGNKLYINFLVDSNYNIKYVLLIIFNKITLIQDNYISYLGHRRLHSHLLYYNRCFTHDIIRQHYHSVYPQQQNIFLMNNNTNI